MGARFGGLYWFNTSYWWIYTMVWKEWTWFNYQCKIPLMQTAKSILCIWGQVLLLCLSFIAILVSISELRYVFTMAPYPYMLFGECCKFIEFMGVEIRTIYYVVLLLICLLIQISCLFVGIYKGTRHKYIQSCILLFVPVVMEIVLNLLSYVI